MSRPEERAAGGDAPSPSPSDASIRPPGDDQPTSTSGDDERGGRPSATHAGRQASSLPTAIDGRPHAEDSTRWANVVRDPTTHHGGGFAGARGGLSGGGGRAHQFRKAKSAATFLLDGVSYTIGKWPSGYRIDSVDNVVFIGFLLMYVFTAHDVATDDRYLLSTFLSLSSNF